MHNNRATRNASIPSLATHIEALKEQKAKRPSPAEIIERNLERIQNAHPAMVSLMTDRAEGALQAMCSLGLIDGDTYLKAGREAYELGVSQRAHHHLGVAK